MKAEILTASEGGNLVGFLTGQVPEGSAVFNTLLHPK